MATYNAIREVFNLIEESTGFLTRGKSEDLFTSKKASKKRVTLKMVMTIHPPNPLRSPWNKFKIYLVKAKRSLRFISKIK